MKNKNVKVTKLICGLAWLSLMVGGFSSSAESLHNMTFIDIKTVENNADTVLIAMLDQIPAPYEVLGKSFYRVNPEDIFDGILPSNSLVIVDTNIDSWKGKPAVIEPTLRYLLFLERINHSGEELPQEYTGFNLVGNWKGIISLDKSAVERRAIQSIERQYGVLLADNPTAFIEAIKFSLKSDNNSGQSYETMPKAAARLYKKLELNKTR